MCRVVLNKGSLSPCSRCLHVNRATKGTGLRSYYVCYVLRRCETRGAGANGHGGECSRVNPKIPLTDLSLSCTEAERSVTARGETEQLPAAASRLELSFRTNSRQKLRSVSASPRRHRTLEARLTRTREQRDSGAATNRTGTGPRVCLAGDRYLLSFFGCCRWVFFTLWVGSDSRFAAAEVDFRACSKLKSGLTRGSGTERHASGGVAEDTR